MYTLGDGVLVTTSSPPTGLRCAANIIGRLHELTMGLDARCGTDHGPVIYQFGDVFGASVNLAARAATRAAPGTIAAPRSFALSATDLGLTATPLGPQKLTGFLEPIGLFQIDPSVHPTWTATDPACGMRLTLDQAIEPANSTTGSSGSARFVAPRSTASRMPNRGRRAVHRLGRQHGTQPGSPAVE